MREGAGSIFTECVSCCLLAVHTEGVANSLHWDNSLPTLREKDLFSSILHQTIREIKINANQIQSTISNSELMIRLLEVVIKPVVATSASDCHYCYWDWGKINGGFWVVARWAE